MDSIAIKLIMEISNMTPKISTEPFVFFCHNEWQYIKDEKVCYLRIIENPRLKMFYVEKRENNYWESLADFYQLKLAQHYCETNFILIIL